MKTPLLTCIIVDDESTARYGLRSYVNKTPRIKCLEEFKNVLELEKYLDHNPSPDIIFLDIQMPEISGMEFMTSRTIDSAIIIVTAYEQYALRGYELNVCDYLLKPVAYARFCKAIDKASLFIDYKCGNLSDDILFVKADRMIHKIHINDIIYLEAMENYLRINTISERITTRTTLKAFLSQLPYDQFVQIHKSYAININHIKTFDSTTILMDSKSPLPLSRTFRTLLLQIISNSNHFRIKS